MIEGNNRPFFFMRTGESWVVTDISMESIDSLRNSAAQHAFKRDFTDEELKDLAEARVTRDMGVFLSRHLGLPYRMYETKFIFFEEYGDVEKDHARVSYPKGDEFIGRVAIELFDPYLSSQPSSN